MSSLVRRLVWLFVLVGLGAALGSLYVHHQLLANPDYTSFCDVNSSVSCSSAYLSRYGSFMGVPVALFGALWFAFVLVTAGLELRAPAPFKESYPGYLFALSTVGLASILYLAYAAIFVLKVVCILCMITWTAVIGLFIVSGIAVRLPMMTLPRRLPADVRSLASRPAALVALVLFFAGAASAVAFFPKAEVAGPDVQGQAAQASADLEAKFQDWYAKLPRMTVPVQSGGAAVTIVRFSDFQCPSCGQTYFTDRTILRKYEAQYPGQVKYVVKDFPLQPDCNPSVTRQYHLAACDAAVAAHLAARRGKGEALSEYFYSHQALLSPASVRELARTVGEVMDFDAQYPRALETVKADVSLARLLGVKVTPTYFINGAKVEGGLPPQSLDMAIATELKKAGKIK